MAPRPHGLRAGEEPNSRALRRQGRRLGRGTMDGSRRPRRGGPRTRADGSALRALCLSGRRRIPEQGAFGHAFRLRRPRGEEVSPAKPRSDALVFFGATGDLAYKKIFPALQAMARRGHLTFPVIGVAESGWNLEQFLGHPTKSVTEHGGLHAEAFAPLSSRLRSLDGASNETAT